jgi:integrase
MVFIRPGGRSWTFTGRYRDTHVQVCTGVPRRNRRLGEKIEHLWHQLAEDREWNLLAPVVEGRLTPGALYDAAREANQSYAEMRRMLTDTDLSPLVDAWDAARLRDLPADTVEHGINHVRWLLPKGERRPASSVTSPWLEERLIAYPGRRNTRRKVHSSWSMFFAWVTRVKRLYRVSPMLEVPRPPLEKGPIRFYELRQARAIVDAQPDNLRQALFALYYGGAVEESVALGLNRDDVWPETREVRAAGTKTHKRDRVARIAEWAWPIFWRYARTAVPGTPLFPDLHRSTVSHWHLKTVRRLKLPQYPLHNARHHWAVHALRDGRATVIEVQQQLGHSSATVTLDVYGQFQTRAEDRARTARAVDRAQKRRAR